MDPGSTVPRRQLGRHLRQLRDQAQLTVTHVVGVLGWSAPKLWRIETGKVPTQIADVMALCRVYSAPDDITEALTGLARETKAKGWWHAYGDTIPNWFELFVSMEAAASHIRQFSTELVPGLLQTDAYTSAVGAAAGWDSTERRLDVRRERQALLRREHREPPTYHAIVHEAALRRPLPEVNDTIRQLRRLFAASKLPHVSLQVLPLDTGVAGAPATCGQFTILQFPMHGKAAAEPDTIYIEALTGAAYLDRPEETAAYHQAWTALETAALSETKTRAMITALIEEMTA